MAIYKFRVTYEDHEDVYRDIEIKSTQSFEEFHKAIQEAIGFDNSKPASFFVSDDYWRKGLEITNVEEEKKEDDDYDDDDAKSKRSPKKLMNKSKLVSFIDDPHQKFLYVSDFTAQWTFCIELIKILLDESKESFPRCVKSSGKAPKQYKATIASVPSPIEEDLDERENEVLLIQEEAYDENEDAEIIQEMETEGEEGFESEEEGENFEVSEPDENYHEED